MENNNINQWLNQIRLEQQQIQSRLIRFDEQAVPNTTLEDIDSLLIRPFIRSHEGDSNVQLQRLHLIADDHGVQRLSGKKPIYQNLSDMELLLTIYAASI